MNTVYAAYDNVKALKIDDFIAQSIQSYYAKHKSFPRNILLNKPHTHYITIGGLKIPVKQSTFISKIGCGFEILTERRPVVYTGRRTPL